MYIVQMSQKLPNVQLHKEDETEQLICKMFYLEKQMVYLTNVKSRANGNGKK